MSERKRLIDANDLVEELTSDRDQDPNRYMYWYQKEERDAKYNFAIDRINEAPAVDAVEVVHGRWIWKGGCFHCSNCKTSNDHTPAYCEGCGARMDGDANA
jgi:hypothetical protein